MSETRNTTNDKIKKECDTYKNWFYSTYYAINVISFGTLWFKRSNSSLQSGENGKTLLFKGENVHYKYFDNWFGEFPSLCKINKCVNITFQLAYNQPSSILEGVETARNISLKEQWLLQIWNYVHLPDKHEVTL